MTQHSLFDTIGSRRPNRATEMMEFIINHVPKEKRTGQNKKQILCDFLWHKYRINLTPEQLAHISHYDRGLRECTEALPDLIADERKDELEADWRNASPAKNDRTSASCSFQEQ
jgi:hypothetical protein